MFHKIQRGRNWTILELIVNHHTKSRLPYSKCLEMFGQLLVTDYRLHNARRLYQFMEI